MYSVYWSSKCQSKLSMSYMAYAIILEERMLKRASQTSWIATALQ